MKTKRERLLDPAYIDSINKIGEILVRFRDEIIVPNGNLADVKNTLGLRYFSNNENKDNIKYTWRVQSINTRSAVIKMNFEDPL